MATYYYTIFIYIDGIAKSIEKDYPRGMLTKDDLSQIKVIVQGETRKIVQNETRRIVKEEIAPLKRDVTKIRKDVDTIVNFFDREYLELRERVENIEHHLGITFSS